MEKILTIIIPTYNMEKYLRKCLDSLIVSSENMERLEVLVVNDGSKDSSSQIAHEYETKYPQTFRVIDKENGGHGSAWNKGVELASGKYLRFLDSDDWLTDLSLFINKLEQYDVDMVFTGVRQVFEDGQEDKLFAGVGMETDIVTYSESFDWSKTNKMYRGYNVTNFHTCTYKTDMLKSHQPIFFEKMFYDDEILFILPLCFAKSFVYFDMYLYNYLLGRVGQTMDKSVQIRNIDFKIKIRKHETLFYKKHKPQSEFVNEKLLFNLNSRHRNTLVLMGALPYKESIKRMAEMVSWLAEVFPEFDGGMGGKLYKISPSCFWLIYNYVQPYYARVKRMLF